MDVFLLLAFIIPLCIWGFWVSQRGEKKNAHLKR
jgi:hypothetical protein